MAENRPLGLNRAGIREEGNAFHARQQREQFRQAEHPPEIQSSLEEVFSRQIGEILDRLHTERTKEGVMASTLAEQEFCDVLANEGLVAVSSESRLGRVLNTTVSFLQAGVRKAGEGWREIDQKTGGALNRRVLPVVGATSLVATGCLPIFIHETPTIIPSRATPTTEIALCNADENIARVRSEGKVAVPVDVGGQDSWISPERAAQMATIRQKVADCETPTEEEQNLVREFNLEVFRRNIEGAIYEELLPQGKLEHTYGIRIKLKSGEIVTIGIFDADNGKIDWKSGYGPSNLEPSPTPTSTVTPRPTSTPGQVATPGTPRPTSTSGGQLTPRPTERPAVTPTEAPMVQSEIPLGRGSKIVNLNTTKYKVVASDWGWKDNVPHDSGLSQYNLDFVQGIFAQYNTAGKVFLLEFSDVPGVGQQRSPYYTYFEETVGNTTRVRISLTSAFSTNDSRAIQLLREAVNNTISNYLIACGAPLSEADKVIHSAKFDIATTGR